MSVCLLLHFWDYLDAPLPDDAKFMLPVLLTYAGPPEPATAARDPFGGALGMQAADFVPQGTDGQDQRPLHLLIPQLSRRQEPPEVLDLCRHECVCTFD